MGHVIRCFQPIYHIFLVLIAFTRFLSHQLEHVLLLLQLYPLLESFHFYILLQFLLILKLLLLFLSKLDMNFLLLSDSVFSGFILCFLVSVLQHIPDRHELIVLKF